ncbi:MAG: hypothetical protein QE271_13520 [Bacteriovoracaceae bacterium]|nr:hypothetical protein [Bacteriovoracaceae bacterium]
MSYLKKNLIFLSFIFVLFFFGCSKKPETDLCVILKLENCHNVGKYSHRSSSQSIPSIGAAAQFNPANVTHDRGFGVELVYQPSQQLVYNFVAGTGKSGAALVSAKLENSFFSNRVPELDSEYLARRKLDDQYKSSKQALGFSIALHKSANLGLDLGVMAKYNPDTSKVNPGAGLALRLGIFSFGASLYADDYKLIFNNATYWNSGSLYSDYYLQDDYSEKFLVQTLTAGIRIKNVFFDFGQIKTNYDFYNSDQVINLYSSSLIIKRWLLSAAYRVEESSNPYYDGENLQYKTYKKDAFGSVQFSLGKAVVLIAQYNYFLLNEFSFGTTIFF